MELDDVGDLDLDFGQDIQDIDLNDIAGGAETLDLSDFDDGGYGGGLDLGDTRAGDLGIGDLDVGVVVQYAFIGSRKERGEAEEQDEQSSHFRIP